MDPDFEAAWQKLTYLMMRKLNGLDSNLTALLHSKDLLSFDEYEKVKSKTVTSDANKELMASVRRRGRSGLDGLVQCLKEEAANTDLVEAIQKEWPPAPNSRVLPSTSDLTSRQMEESKELTESEVFVKHFAYLMENVTDPEEIAAQLLASGVITDNEKDVTANVMSAAQMDKLLPAVQRATRISTKNFDTFMEVLGAKYADLVKEMKATRNGPTDEGKVLVKFYAKLRSVVNPIDICAALFAKGVISAAEKADIEHNMTANACDRMNKLLTAVAAAIRIDKKNIYIFLDVLNKKDKYQQLVATIKEDLPPDTK